MIYLNRFPKRKTGGRYLRQEVPNPNRKKDAAAAALTDIAYFFFAIVYLELIMHLVAFGAPSLQFAYVAGFSLVFACALALVTSFLPQKGHFAVTIVITVVLIILFGSQIVYYYVFGTLYSVAQMQMGGAAVTSFWRETLSTMWDHLPWLLVLFIPLFVLILLRKFSKKSFAPANSLWRILFVVIAVAAQLVCVLSLPAGGTGYFTNYYFYYSNSTTPDQAAARFGLLTAFRLDLTGSADTEEESSYYIPEATEAPTEAPKPTENDPDSLETVSEPVEETVPPTEPTYNIVSIDFDALNEMTTDKKLLTINAYCSSLSGTKQNEYTGMLSGYNLVVVCGESFSTAALDPNLTPTLYRMANEGIIFTNFYNSFPNNTIDGEYALCMGLYPDTSRDKSSNSFLASRLNYLPFCLGNAFQEQLGIQSYGYHNNKRDYYSRGVSHPNMGYSMKFSGSGMTFSSNAWPKSDLEMMEQSVDDFITMDQFNAYYMTFSGHMKYNTNVNNIAAKNWDAVADLDYSEEARAYLSCNIELDKAMEYLMQKLEEQGVADRTVIVLVGDHFPYGLTDEQYSELIGYTIDDFSKYKSSLLFWVGGLEENIVVDEYCCNVDILPTILNLWGFEYDSRLLAGTDVFSDSEHVAVRIDKSFYTDKVWLNANTGEIKYLVDENQLPANYVENMVKTIETKFSISADILNNRYYNFVFQTGSDAVTWQYKTAETETEPTT